MKECTETDKPLVSIVMATYNPRMDWLKEQLVSLNNQSYEKLELLVIDDCSTKVSFEEICATFKTYITEMPYQISRNVENLGSTRTFEKLTMLASGDYIAYCDQDDIWHWDKIKTLISLFLKESVNLAYSDVQVIDESGNIKTNCITEFRPRHILNAGGNLSGTLMLQNFVIGCTMLIKSEIAKVSIPFIPDMVHDHYLALMASLDGELALCKEPLVSYRIHDENQTNTLTGIMNKEDYYSYKIKSFLSRMGHLESKNISAKVPEFNNIKRWAEARAFYYKGNFKSARIIWKYRNFDYGISLFELIMQKMPDILFKCALQKIKEGKI